MERLGCVMLKVVNLDIQDVYDIYFLPKTLIANNCNWLSKTITFLRTPTSDWHPDQKGVKIVKSFHADIGAKYLY